MLDQASVTNASVTDADANFNSNSSGPPPWGNYTGPPVPPGSQPPPSPVEAIVYSYGSSIVFRRWAATMLDLVFFAGLVGTLFFFNNRGLILVVYGFALLYHLLLEGFTGYTVGKYILRIQVVREDGRPPGFVKSLVRTLLRLLETNPILVGAFPAGICALVTKKKQRLGDMAANTYVVKVADLYFKKPSRRTKNIMAVIFSTLILVAVLPNVIAWTITGYPEFETQSVIHKSEDGRFQITDSNFLKRDSSGVVELDANLALSNTFNTKHIVVFTYSKEEMGTELTLRDFYLEMKDLQQDNMTSIVQERKFVVDSGGIGYEVTYRHTVDGDPYMYITGYVETSEHFHEVTAIMDVRNYEEYGPELRAAIATFREVDP